MGDVWAEMVSRWPSAIVSRQEAAKFSGGAVSPKFLANCDSLGTGPKGRFHIGRKCCYSAQNLTNWLRARAN